MVKYKLHLDMCRHGHLTFFHTGPLIKREIVAAWYTGMVITIESHIRSNVRSQTAALCYLPLFSLFLFRGRFSEPSYQKRGKKEENCLDCVVLSTKVYFSTVISLSTVHFTCCFMKSLTAFCRRHGRVQAHPSSLCVRVCVRAPGCCWWL